MDSDEFSFSDLMASSIHDMKNSLMLQIHALESVAGQLQGKGDPDSAQQMAGIVHEANRMNSNLIQLLALYKFDKAIYPMDEQEHCLLDLIEEAISQGKSSMAYKGVRVEVQCDADLFWYVDRDLITGILINALNNAYNYTKDCVRVIARIQDGWLELRVEDNGSGYPERMLVNGLAPQGVRFASGSTGLGFHFAARAARMHKNGGRQGALTIENGGSLGGGCFVVHLP
jgi:K+-sensing histidine kinase KdpD